MIETSIAVTINYYCSTTIFIPWNNWHWRNLALRLKKKKIPFYFTKIVHDALAEGRKSTISHFICSVIIFIYISHCRFLLVEWVAAVMLSDLLRLSATTLSCCNQAITRAPSPLLSNSAFFHNYPLKHSVRILDAWRWSTLEYCIAGRPLP